METCKWEFRNRSDDDKLFPDWLYPWGAFYSECGCFFELPGEIEDMDVLISKSNYKHCPNCGREIEGKE